MDRFLIILVSITILFLSISWGQKAGQQTQQNVRTNNSTNKTVDDKYRGNYQAVIDQLNQRFSGYKENCFPLPKGRCRCVTKAKNGSEVVTVYPDENVSCKTVLTTPANRRNG